MIRAPPNATLGLITAASALNLGRQGRHQSHVCRFQAAHEGNDALLSPLDPKFHLHWRARDLQRREDRYIQRRTLLRLAVHARDCQQLCSTSMWVYSEAPSPAMQEWRHVVAEAANLQLVAPAERTCKERGHEARVRAIRRQRRCQCGCHVRRGSTREGGHLVQAKGLQRTEVGS